MGQLILRREALLHCALLEQTDYRLLIVQAQAGQGKTVLVTQFEQESDIPFAWVNCTAADAVAPSLFGKLTRSIDAATPGFSGPAVLAALNQPLSMDEYLDIASARLASELETAGGRLLVVIDDAHLLNDSPSAKRLLRQITERTPPFVKFAILTRFPLDLDGEPLFPASRTLNIDQSLLAFGREEIALLYNNVFGIPTDTRRVNRLLDATEGWVAGLVLLRSSSTIHRLTGADRTRSLGRYFDELVEASLSPQERRELLRLSLLDEIRASHLSRLASPPVARWIEDKAGADYFLHARTQGRERIFRLHHLFQDYLAAKASETLSDKERRFFLVLVSELYMDGESPLEGLRCLLKAKSWTRLAEAFEAYGPDLLAENAHQALSDMLNRIPEDIRQNDPWICFMHGATLLALDPAASAPSLIRAIELGNRRGAPACELLATCSLVHYHLFINWEFGKKGVLINRATYLFEGLRDSLSETVFKNCAQTIALARVYDAPPKADHYLALAERAPGTGNQWMGLTRLLILGMRGEMEAALDALSPLFPQTNMTWASPTSRFSMLVIHVNYLLMAGRFTAYRAFRDRIHRDWADYAKTSYLGVFLTVWDLDLLTQEGRHEEVLRRIEQCPIDFESYPPHMTSQLRHYEMLACAHLGRFERMDRAMRQALRLRSKAGGGYFLLLTHCLTMASLSLAGRRRSALRSFDACKRAQDRTWLYHGQLIYAYRAAMFLREGEDDEARDDVRELLGQMERLEARHFFGWSPEVMEPVLSFAVREGVHAPYARMLAREQMSRDILDDGTVVPLLGVRVVGGMRLSLGGAVIPDEEMTPMWRRMISLLALAPRHSMTLPDIQTVLWPEQDPSESRSKLDVNLSRLRSKLSAFLGRGAGKRHLQTEGQRLRLAHCDVDCDRILSRARKGLDYARNGSPWRAHTAFVVMARDIGHFEDPAAALRLPGPLLAPVMEALTGWVVLLRGSNAFADALAVAAKALTLDPINDTLQRERYDLLTALGRPMEAVQSLREYRNILSRHDFSEEEIDMVIDALLSGAGR